MAGEGGKGRADSEIGCCVNRGVPCKCWVTCLWCIGYKSKVVGCLRSRQRASPLPPACSGSRETWVGEVSFCNPGGVGRVSDVQLVVGLVVDLLRNRFRGNRAIIVFISHALWHHR